MKTPKREKVSITYYGNPREIDGYRIGDNLTIHRSVNHKRRWTVTHNGTGFLLVDNIRSRDAALNCASRFRRLALRLRKTFGVELR